MNSEFGKKTIPHIDLLFTYAVLVTGDNRKAEKILSQTFAKAYWFWNHLSEEIDVKLWLIRIMMNIFRSTPAYSERANAQILQNKSTDLATINMQDNNKEFDYQKKKHLSQLISSLPLTLKEVIIFTDVFKFRDELAADLVEVPEGVIRKRLIDARKIILFGWLQKKLKELSVLDAQISLEDKILIINTVGDKELEDSKNEKAGLLKQEIESQSYVKNIIDKNISLQSVREAIKLKLINKYAAELKDEIKKETSPERRGVVTIATIAMIILITVLIILFRPPQENPGEYAAQQVGEDNILVQLKNNYSLFLDGKFDTNLIIGNEMTIKDFLSTAGFRHESMFPRFTGWDIKSLFLTSYKEVQITNLIYENEVGRNFYLYQIPLQLVDEKHILNLTPELMDYLDSNNCYSSRNGTTLYLLKKTEGHIVGFVLEDPKKEVIIEICSKSYKSIF
jgi:RNA polymerase sigma-70 factor (ECF subfamily)